jgi:hypothetical protein
LPILVVYTTAAPGGSLWKIASNQRGLSLPFRESHLSHPGNRGNGLVEFRPLSINHGCNEIIVAAPVEGIGSERGERLVRFAGKVRLIGRVLMAKFPGVSCGDIAGYAAKELIRLPL